MPACGQPAGDIAFAAGAELCGNSCSKNRSVEGCFCSAIAPVAGSAFFTGITLLSAGRIVVATGTRRGMKKHRALVVMESLFKLESHTLELSTAAPTAARMQMGRPLLNDLKTWVDDEVFLPQG